MLDRLGGVVDQITAYLSVLAVWLIPAGFGRGAWYAYQWRHGNRKLTVGMAAGEAVIAVFMAIVAGGIGGRLGLVDKELMAFIGLASWLGPGGFFAIAARVLRLDWPPKQKT